MAEPLLRLAGLSRHYAGLAAVDGVDLSVPRGGVHALIGPNGAGKTTLFNLVSGLEPPSRGTILFDGADITAWPPHRRARAGLARTFQTTRLFPEMTALETVLVGLHMQAGGGVLAGMFRPPSLRRTEAGLRRRALEALDTVGLSDRCATLAGALPHGDQRRLEIARAIAAGPRLLLLDEPAAGMTPAETVGLAGLVQKIAASGTTLLLVEHDMGFVMGLADSVTVLSFGRTLFTGSPAEARRNPAVIEAYLGPRLAQRLSAS